MDEPDSYTEGDLAQWRAATLEFVNELREEHDLPPLDVLPAGLVLEALDCPVARAVTNCFDGTVEVSGTHVEVNGGEKVDLPDAVGEFIAAFDDGAYPDLIAT